LIPSVALRRQQPSGNPEAAESDGDLERRPPLAPKVSKTSSMFAAPLHPPGRSCRH